MKYLFILVLTLFMITEYGCSTKFYCKRCPITTKDSLVTIVKDSIVETIDTAYVSDSSSMRLLIKCDSLGNIYIDQLAYLQTHPKIELKYRTIGNQLKIDCKVDSLAVYNKLKSTYHTESKVIKQVVEKPAEKYIPKFFIWLLVGSLVINVLFIGLKFIKLKLF